MEKPNTERRGRGRPRAFHDKTEQNTIQSLDRAMMILESLATSGGMTLTELSNRLEQSPATAYRVLTTLETRGIVELDGQSQTWHVGAGAFRIGSAFLRRTNLVERARPVMHALMEATGENPSRIVGEGFMPSWSPDGRRIAFVSDRVANESRYVRIS